MIITARVSICIYFLVEGSEDWVPHIALAISFGNTWKWRLKHNICSWMVRVVHISWPNDETVGWKAGGQTTGSSCSYTNELPSLTCISKLSMALNVFAALLGLKNNNKTVDLSSFMPITVIGSQLQILRLLCTEGYNWPWRLFVRSISTPFPIPFFSIWCHYARPIADVEKPQYNGSIPTGDGWLSAVVTLFSIPLRVLALPPW